jgi:cyclophilin family peptidyl-prolyl cis-trans isomerase
MGINAMDVVKDNKQIFLSMGAIILVAILIVIVNGKGGVFQVSDNLVGVGTTDGVEDDTGVQEPVDNDEEKQYTSAPNNELKANVDYQARIATNYGAIVIDLYEEDTPVAVNNFVFLADDGFYSGLKFHRIIEGFIIQGGDPVGDGTGGPGYEFKDEIDADAIGLDDLLVKNANYLIGYYSATQLSNYASDSVKKLYEDVDGYDYTSGFGTHKFKPYVIAMANSGANTNGSQFFITLLDSQTDHLNGKHTVFGEVVDGFNVVDDIGGVSTDSDGVPKKAVTITSIQIVEE